MPTLKNKLKFFLRNFGIDIGKYNLSECDDFRLNHFLKINDIDCVLDVGANNSNLPTELGDDITPL